MIFAFFKKINLNSVIEGLKTAMNTNSIFGVNSVGNETLTFCFQKSLRVVNISLENQANKSVRIIDW